MYRCTVLICGMVTFAVVYLWTMFGLHQSHAMALQYAFWVSAYAMGGLFGVIVSSMASLRQVQPIVCKTERDIAYKQLRDAIASGAYPELSLRESHDRQRLLRVHIHPPAGLNLMQPGFARDNNKIFLTIFVRNDLFVADKCAIEMIWDVPLFTEPEPFEAIKTRIVDKVRSFSLNHLCLEVTTA